MGRQRTAPRRRSPRNPLGPMFARHVTEATVTDAEQVTPAMRRIRLVAGKAFESYVPGQHIRIQLNDPLSVYGILRPAETLRSYTVWDYDEAERAIELRAHLYEGDGIGLRWARSVRPGDDVTFWGPLGEFTTRPAPYHVFAGEETATAAFGPMLGALGGAERVFGVLESERAGDELAVPGPETLRRVHREGAPAVASPTLLAAVSELDLPDEPGIAYVAGEARTCQLVRDHLVRERGWPRKAVVVKPFWAEGKRGLH